MFKISLPITISTIELTKRALTKALPEVKSSHRCEAMARGFGYRTHASLLVDTRSNDERTATVDCSPFCDYMDQHNFKVSGSVLCHAVAKVALCGVAKRYPRLTASGFGIGDWDPEKTPAERRRDFAKDRAELVSDYAVKPFLASLAFVSRVERTKTIRPATNSYWLKHIAENYECTYPNGEKLGPIYVPNGVLIAAAIHAGFNAQPHKDEYGGELLNAGFNMSKASLYDLDCEIRHEGARAEARRTKARQRAAGRMPIIF